MNDVAKIYWENKIPKKMRNKMNEKIVVDKHIVLEMVFWARRYCDQRATYAPTDFNKMYKTLEHDYPEIFPSQDQKDKTLMHGGKYWPYAQDGMYREDQRGFDARK